MSLSDRFNLFEFRFELVSELSCLVSEEVRFSEGVFLGIELGGDLGGEECFLLIGFFGGFLNPFSSLLLQRLTYRCRVESLIGPWSIPASVRRVFSSLSLRSQSFADIYNSFIGDK